VRVIDTGFERDQLDWLRRGELDLLAARLPVEDPAITTGPVLSRERRVVAVSTNHPLAHRHAVCLDDLADYPVSDINTLPRAMMDAFIPPNTPSGKPIRRVLVRTIAESLARVALGETIHPTVESFLEHARHPNVTAVPITDLPPSETALIWLTEHTSPRIRVFASIAEELQASYTGRRPRAEQAAAPVQDRLSEAVRGGSWDRLRPGIDPQSAARN
jgi:hypothetical protein